MSEVSNRRKERDYERAFREARRLLYPGTQSYPSQRGVVKGDTDAWRLARAQWLYDWVSKAMGERELKDINMFRASRNLDPNRENKYPMLDLKR